MNVLTKKECYRLYHSGLFGNKARTWDSYKEILASGWAGKVCMRSKAGTARKNVIYRISIEDLPKYIAEWNRMGIKESQIAFNESMPDESLLIQGELMNDIWGHYLLYTNVKKPMNLALREDEKHARGLRALMLLKANLCPSSLSDIEALLDIYPKSAIEFSTYSVCVGDIPNRNTVIWEVRDF